METNKLDAALGLDDLGQAMHEMAKTLYPFPRSMTGAGVRQTLQVLGQGLPMQMQEVASGTAVLDWTVPDEWTLRQAWIKGPDGKRIVDLADSSLHVVGNSAPVHKRLPLSELQEKLHSLPDSPTLVPYRTGYFKRDWGFCLSDALRQTLVEGEYEVLIDSDLKPGHLSYGELLLPGESDEEVLISAHVCHPALCNDNLSGNVVAAFLARWLASVPHRLSYRFLFIPATLGSITWLSQNEAGLDRIRAGLVLSLLGDEAPFTYKRSRRDDAEIDRAVAHVLGHEDPQANFQAFEPYGYDERQFCSPGFNLPVGCLMRSPHGTFPEYHTSADNLDFIKPSQLEASLKVLAKICQVLEGNETYLNLNPKGEPQLGRRGIFKAFGERKEDGLEIALLWVLNFSDAEHSLLEIADRSRMPFRKIRAAADVLLEQGLLKTVR